ncbi:NCK-interacting protein with SH3 domain-like [Drosophila nasuta]|uniref:NCK-interacting protein with SH3 domain-like n=1 Tax=Drosophila nasuta TaxID=42062 RepID=UPI00295ECD4B|nr:NCK-interacting protein with SH3 domain-like [Drosophila nasuta]
MVIALILAFNQQFSEHAVNVIIEAMQNRPTAKVFTEKLLLLLNREDDPTRLLKHHNEHMNTVLRMFIDIFSHPDTAGMFYTNHINDLIDIVVRQLSDLDAGNVLITSVLFGAVSSHFAQHKLSGPSASQARSHEDLYAHLLRGDRMQCIRSAVSARNRQRISPIV